MKKIEINLKSLLLIVKLGLLKIVELEGAERKIEVKEISIMNNNTLVCEFYPFSKQSMDIKVEISTIMGFLSGFFKGNPYKGISFKYFAVRAYNEDDKEILYAISSIKSAKLIAEGNSIDWLKSTLFQENTDDYRLSIAKRIISEIEKSLRYAIENVLFEEYGQEWWSIALNNKLGKGIIDTYERQFGEVISNGKILLDYTFLLDLKKIITTHWLLFKKYFKSKTEFELTMDRLNIIRRDEAHNRIIDESQIKELENIYTILLNKLSNDFDISSNYLIDNWRMNIKKIMLDEYIPLYSQSEIIDESNLVLKLTRTIESSKHIIEYLNDTILRLKSIVVPIQKKNIHDELTEIFEQYEVLQSEKLNHMKNGEIKEALIVSKQIENYNKKMIEFSNKILLTET